MLAELGRLVFVGHVVAVDALEDNLRAPNDLIQSVALNQVLTSRLGELTLLATSLLWSHENLRGEHAQQTSCARRT